MKKLHITVVLSAVFFVGVILSWITWTVGGGRETFISLSSYIFISLSLIIATAAAASSAISSMIASSSLKLTRATQRPFLNKRQFYVDWSSTDGKQTSVNYFCFGYYNKGAFPADQVSVLMKISKKETDDKQYLFAASEGTPSLCFPNEEIVDLRFTEVDDKEKLVVDLKDELIVRIEIEYKNKLTQETYKTNRSYLVQYDPTARGDPTPLPKEDRWD